MREFFTTYGSFITLGILGIGYLIKRHYDLESKRIELNYSFFQEHKIKAIRSFFENYGKAERMWHSFGIHKVIERKISTTDLDNIVWPVLNPMKTTLMELSLYLSDEDIKPFEKIYQNLMQVQKVVSRIYFNEIEGNSIVLSNEYGFKLMEVNKENEQLLRQIGNQTRIMFNVDKN